MILLLRRQWTEWIIAITFLRDGHVQTAMIMIGIAVGVAVIVFVSALIEGLQTNIINRTLGTQSHIRLLSPDEVNIVIPAAPGTVQLLQEDKRAQRLRSINNWQGVTATLDSLPILTAVSPVVSGPALRDAATHLSRSHWSALMSNVTSASSRCATIYAQASFVWAQVMR